MKLRKLRIYKTYIKTFFENNQEEKYSLTEYCNDIQITQDGKISLRAERDGEGNGRIYTITYSATDASGNKATASVIVTVPHDMGDGKK